MHEDTLRDVLFPPEGDLSAESFAAPAPIGIDPGSADEPGLRLSQGAHVLEIKDVLPRLRAAALGADIPASLSGARMALDNDTPAVAALGFLLLMEREDALVPALWGFCGALVMLDEAEAVEGICTFMMEALPKLPLSHALMGHLAHRNRNAADSRRYLARAAHLARRDRRCKAILHFAQRSLLEQQFGGGPGTPSPSSLAALRKGS